MEEDPGSTAKSAVSSNSWNCMNCINPISQLCDAELFDVCDSFSIPQIPLISEPKSKPAIAKGLGHLNING
jgi:hypothetical protein